MRYSVSPWTAAWLRQYLRHNATPLAEGEPGGNTDRHPAQVRRDQIKVKPVDVALVAVHGMGRQRQAETLLEWAEPVLGRIDWLTTRTWQPGVDGQPEIPRDRLGVTVEQASLTSEPKSLVVVTARWLAEGAVQERRIAVLEARWSESFVPMTRADVFQWGARFLWRSLVRMFLQFARTMLGVPWITLYPTHRTHGTATRAWRRVLAVPMVLAGALLTGVVAVVLAAFGVLTTLLLTLLSPLLLIPVVKNMVQAGVDVLVDFVGDVGTFRSRPLRAAAMGDVVVDALHRATDLLARDDRGEPTGQISVLAHSQGAAVAVNVLFRNRHHDLDLTAIPVTRLATIGAAITLLGTTAWNPTPDKRSEYRPIANWVRNAPQIVWSNYWAVWDPFSAGPVGDSYRDRRRRWRACYDRPPAAATDAAPYYPAEHAVHNTSSPFSDHQSYGRNTLQVVDPIARELLGPEFAELEPLVTPDGRDRAARVARVVRLRRARSVTLIASIVAAVLLPLLDGLRSSVGTFIDVLLAGVNWATGLVGAAPLTAPTAGLLGTAVLTIVFASVLIWLNTRFFDWAERRLIWQGRTPTENRIGLTALERRVGVFGVLMQLGFVGGAAAVVFVVSWQAGAAFPGGLPGLAIALGLLVALVLLAVRAGKLPQPAPGSQPPVPGRTGAPRRLATPDQAAGRRQVPVTSPERRSPRPSDITQ